MREQLIFEAHDGAGGIYRCEIRNCQASLQAVTRDGWLEFPVVSADQLFYWRARAMQPNKWQLGSCSLPGCAGFTPLISGGWDSTSAAAPVALGGALYFFLTRDQALYRCALPDCANGPELVWEGADPRNFVSNGSTLLWQRGFDALIHRAAEGGRAAVEVLVPDLELRAASEEEEELGESGQNFALQLLAVSETTLYGALDDYSSPVQLVAWPASGHGPRRIVHHVERVSSLQVFDDELVWSVERSPQIGLPATELWSCLADDCANTERQLGTTRAYSGDLVTNQVAADERELFWFEQQEDYRLNLRHVARLSPK